MPDWSLFMSQAALEVRFIMGLRSISRVSRVKRWVSQKECKPGRAWGST